VHHPHGDSDCVFLKGQLLLKLHKDPILGAKQGEKESKWLWAIF